MKYIKLHDGSHTMVDDNWYEHLSQWKWRKSKDGYAYRRGYNGKKPNGTSRYKYIWMHRLILDTPEGKYTDHINGNKLDNRLCNLRICNDKQNSANRQPKGRYKGVYYDQRFDKYRANIKGSNGKDHLGGFDTPEEAAQAYDDAANYYFGEFAYLNFPDREPKPYNPKQARSRKGRYIGVCWHKTKEKWVAYINVKGERIHLGSFIEEEEAARAYDMAAIIHKGNKAKLNFP